MDKRKAFRKGTAHDAHSRRGRLHVWLMPLTQLGSWPLASWEQLGWRALGTVLGHLEGATLSTVLFGIGVLYTSWALKNVFFGPTYSTEKGYLAFGTVVAGCCLRLTTPSGKYLAAAGTIAASIAFMATSSRVLGWPMTKLAYTRARSHSCGRRLRGATTSHRSCLLADRDFVHPVASLVIASIAEALSRPVLPALDTEHAHGTSRTNRTPQDMISCNVRY